MPNPSPDNSPVISEEADRVLGRIIVRHGLLTFALLVAASFGMAFVNIPQSPLFRWHKPLDFFSVLVVLTPFFAGMNKLFAARLELGRDLVRRRRWREAIAALDPFAGPSQRFLDGNGEAHYLLAQAYAGAGDAARAERARAFLRRHRPGPWAEKLQSDAATPSPRRVGQEKPKRPANTKRRRRF
ncbi:MAG: hypothetical protein JO250_19480 [Armatimonadetes bacterium]|nr:hypothetical protein [Armatimonadota bacterium]